LAATQHKVFISYHHDDQTEVDAFIREFDERGNVFITRAVGVGMDQSIIDSDDPDYVMQRIRRLYLADSTVTLVLLGQCTWARRFIDWEIQASLRQGEHTTPNGLLGIVLKSARENPVAPERLRINLGTKGQDDHYASWYHYPNSSGYLTECVETAYLARYTRTELIKNPRDRMKQNRTCP
jgi:hypothetical protein